MRLSKMITVSTVLSAFALTAGYCEDFPLAVLTSAQNPTFDLHAVAKRMSYYDYVRSTLGQKILELAPRALSSRTNVSELQAGHGVSVKLSQNNFNVHVNFPALATGGRSYGWTDGQVGDWSDAMYLNHLDQVVHQANPQELGNFYALLIQILGACNSDDQRLSIEMLAQPTQRVATNFVAIYTAEAYRAMVPQPFMNWDDALFEVTMLGAFHGGQSTMTMFYEHQFTSTTKKQNSGVYDQRRAAGPTAATAPSKPAAMNDYWQFSANPTSKQSGINETRADFQRMGEAITKFEATVAHNPNLATIQSIVGGNPQNVIWSISRFFTTGKAKNLAQVDVLSHAVAQFMLDVRKDANNITAWELNGEK